MWLAAWSSPSIYLCYWGISNTVASSVQRVLLRLHCRSFYSAHQPHYRCLCMLRVLILLLPCTLSILPLLMLLCSQVVAILLCSHVIGLLDSWVVASCLCSQIITVYVILVALRLPVFWASRGFMPYFSTVVAPRCLCTLDLSVLRQVVRPRISTTPAELQGQSANLVSQPVHILSLSLSIFVQCLGNV